MFGDLPSLLRNASVTILFHRFLSHFLCHISLLPTPTEVKFDPLQILKEDLQDEDHSVQIEGAKKIPVVATAIGPKRARKDLIDFLSEYLNESSDETMVAIGKAMADVAKFSHFPKPNTAAPSSPNLHSQTAFSFLPPVLTVTQASTSLGSIIQDMGKNEVEKQIMPILERMANAEWFQPRVGVSKLLPMAYPKASEGSQKTIIEWFGHLCKDENPMAKKAALINMATPTFLPPCSMSWAWSSHARREGNSHQMVSEVLGELMEDTSQTVRASVSAALGEIAVLCESKVRQAIFDVMKVAVKDEDSLVRCNTLESIQHVAKNVKNPPPSLFTMLQPFASDPKWRVRRDYISVKGYLRASTAFSVASSKTESDTSFDQKLTNNLIECLSDHISSIREEACVQLGEIVGIKGSEWGIKTLLPEALKSVSQSDMGEQSNYITRMTGLVLVTNVSKHLSADQIEKHVVGFVEQCLKDVVENVRFKAARTCEAILPRTSKKVVRERLIPALENVQKGEQDQDILFYSEQALHLARRHCGN
eukprot:jgi/Bigna1/70769/fgenesh1_pg.13_\